MANSGSSSGRVFRHRPLLLEALEDRRLLTVTGWNSFARDAQHTAQSTVAAQSLSAVHWETPVDSAPQYSGGDLFIHYGSPLVTVANSVIVPEKNEATPGGFDIKAFDGATGALKWTQTEGEEFLPPSHDWVPSYSPALAALPGGPRLYFPGAGGTILYRDSPDASGALTPGRIAFYGTANYNANPAGFSGVRISSPLTTDSQGNLFFTYQTSGSNQLNLQGGIARIGADGSTTFVQAGTPALDSAPALSNDGRFLYAVIDGQLGLYDSTTLVQSTHVQLGFVHIDSTASPTVGPNGDVFIGVLSPSVHSRGTLEHFSASLLTTYPSGSFGWDDTVSIVPTSMVPSYTGLSPYLLMTKANDYAGSGGSGVNQIALFDPIRASVLQQVDPVTGQLGMPTVLRIAGVTPDEEFPFKPGAVREWCINNAAVDPATHSIFANSEDGWLYRWDTATNTFTQSIQLTSGVGEAYTPTVIGADGTVFAINNAVLFAIGDTPSLTISDAAVVEGNSGTTNAVFTVSLSSSTANTVTVEFASAAGTATSGADYQTTSGTLTFAPATTLLGGSTTQTITVPILGDTQVEPDETFFLNLTNPTQATIARTPATGTIENDDSSVTSRQLFYANSAYDGYSGIPAIADDEAIAPDKVALLPSTVESTFANVSAYTAGINGIMIDMTTLPAHSNLVANAKSDFVFKVSGPFASNAPSTWTTLSGANLPAVSVRFQGAATTGPSGLGPGGTLANDRIELIWPDGTIKGTFLQVTVKAGTDSGLQADSVFYFGSSPGDTGFGNDPDASFVDATDEISERNNQESDLSLNHPYNTAKSNVYDVNKDDQVDATDQIFARNFGATNPELDYILPIPPFAPAAGAAVASALSTINTFTNSSSRVQLPTWPGNQPPNVDSNFGKSGSDLNPFAQANSLRDRAILVEAARVGDALGVAPELLEVLSAELGRKRPI